MNLFKNCRKENNAEILKRFQEGTHLRSVSFKPETFCEEDRTIDAVFTTGAEVRRYDWFEGEYIEELEVSEEAIDMSRLNSGAPFLDTHKNRELGNVIGTSLKGYIEISEDGDNEGRALLKFSSRESVKPIIEDVKDGILRNISVGYEILACEERTVEGKKHILVTRWRPLEISLVPIPADAGAQVRSNPVNEYKERKMSQTKENPQNAEVNAEEIRSATLCEAKQIAQLCEIGNLGLRDYSDILERGLSLSDAQKEIISKRDAFLNEERIRTHLPVSSDETSAASVGSLAERAKKRYGGNN